jgi:outer membrane immunogenic protein
MRRIVALSSVLVVMSSAAIAADLPRKAPVAVMAAPAMNWTGFWIGGHVGYTWGEGKSSTAGDPVVDFDGVSAGVALGYDWHLPNNFVLGAFVSVPFFGPDQTYNPVPAIAITAEMNWAVVVGGRVGYALGRVMPYGFAGVVFGEGELTSAAFPAVNQTQSHTGWTAGAGIDYALTPNWIVGARYAYVDTGRETYTGFVPARSISFTGSNAALTLRYKFF